MGQTVQKASLHKTINALSGTQRFARRKLATGVHPSKSSRQSQMLTLKQDMGTGGPCYFAQDSKYQKLGQECSS